MRRSRPLRGELVDGVPQGFAALPRDCLAERGVARHRGEACVLVRSERFEPLYGKARAADGEVGPQTPLLVELDMIEVQCFCSRQIH